MPKHEVINTISPPSKADNLTHPKYRADIDGLRAIAVLSVVCFHAFPRLLKGGFIGVDIFFIISGFLISTIIFDNLERGSFSFIEFYSRRINRIFPALLLVLVTCLAFGWFALLADEYKQLGKHIAAGAGFVSNFVFWNESGYFDNTAETKPLLHLWTLGIEEQFYIVWPLLLWTAWKGKFNLLTLTLVIATISFALNIKGLYSDAIATFYSPQTRFWELLIGSLLAYVTLYKPNIWARNTQKLNTYLNAIIYTKSTQGNENALRNVQSFLGAALIGAGLLIITKERHFPGTWALLPTLGATLIISAGSQAWLNRVLLSNRVLVWFGLISFPLYLWHWPLLSFARIVESETPSKNIRIAAVIISIVLAWLTYKFIEKPIRFSKFGNVKTLVLAVLMIVVGSIGYYTYNKHGFKYRKNIEQISLINNEFVGPLWKYTKNNICQSKYPLAGSEKYSWWFCMASSQEKPTLLLLGNSYANHFYPGITFNENLKHHSVLSIGTCGAEWVEKSSLNSEETTSPCSGYRSVDQLELINNIIVDEKSIRYVIVGGLNPNPNAEYIEKLKRRIDFLETNGIKVILFTPHIRINYDIKSCYGRPFREKKQTCEISVDTYNDMLKNFKILVDAIKTTNPNVLIFDQNNIFCNGETCKFKLPIMPAFRDEYAHLSEFASKLLMEKFVDWARINTPEILSP
jgi:peptidoglycan/LPS O-acetylase OafA/YrhL